MTSWLYQPVVQLLGQLDCVLSNKSILCDKELFETILIILEEQRLVYIQMRRFTAGFESRILFLCAKSIVS